MCLTTVTNLPGVGNLLIDVGRHLQVCPLPDITLLTWGSTPQAQNLHNVSNSWPWGCENLSIMIPLFGPTAWVTLCSFVLRLLKPCMLKVIAVILIDVLVIRRRLVLFVLSMMCLLSFCVAIPWCVMLSTFLERLMFSIRMLWTWCVTLTVRLFALAVMLSTWRGW